MSEDTPQPPLTAEELAAWRVPPMPRDPTIRAMLATIDARDQEIAHLKAILGGIERRFHDAEAGGRAKDWSVAWAMMEDAKSALRGQMAYERWHSTNQRTAAPEQADE